VKALVYIAAMAPEEAKPSANCYTSSTHASAPALVPTKAGFSDVGRWFRQKQSLPRSRRRNGCDGGHAEAIAVSCLGRRYKPAWRRSFLVFVAERDE